jgi:hypothetical protein
MKPLGNADPKLSRSSAMAGPLDDQKALAAIVLWNSGHFDTYDIGLLLSASEDAICRTLHAARHIAKGGV